MLLDENLDRQRAALEEQLGAIKGRLRKLEVKQELQRWRERIKAIAPDDKYAALARQWAAQAKDGRAPCGAATVIQAAKIYDTYSRLLAENGCKHESFMFHALSRLCDWGATKMPEEKAQRNARGWGFWEKMRGTNWEKMPAWEIIGTVILLGQSAALTSMLKNTDIAKCFAVDAPPKYWPYYDNVQYVDLFCATSGT